MRVVMFGYQTWGHRTLQALLDSEHDVVTVVTHPRSEHAYEKIWSDSVADLAEKHGVPVIIRNRPDDALYDLLAEAAPDIIVANNWRTWIPPRIYDLPRHGTLNIHDSLLPAYVSFSPLIWALVNGEKEVGVTAHLMDEELDGKRHRRPARGGRGTDGHRHRPLPPDGRPDRPGDGRGPRPDRLRADRVHPAGPVEGQLLPQAGRRGHPYRLELA